MDLGEQHRKAVEWWKSRVDAVEDDQWSSATPCSDWDVRALVNHVVGEELWIPPLVEGQTIEQVGDRFDGDVLGADPLKAADAAAQDGADAMADGVAKGGIVHLSFGDFPVEEYANQLTADHLIHGWDLAAATGQDRTLDPELVEHVAGWFTGVEQLYRDSGAVAGRVEAGGDPQADLLGRFGRSAGWSAP